MPGISRALVQDYFQACVSRDPARIAAYLDDDIEWSCTGPVDLLHFCGHRRGKRAALDNIVRLAPSVIELTRIDLEEVLIDGDCAATFTRLSATHVRTGRNVSYRCAQFLRFRNNKLVEFRGLMDSFDAVEQVLGHPIELPPAQTRADNVVAI